MRCPLIQICEDGPRGPVWKCPNCGSTISTKIPREKIHITCGHRTTVLTASRKIGLSERLATRYLPPPGDLIARVVKLITNLDPSALTAGCGCKNAQASYNQMGWYEAWTRQHIIKDHLAKAVTRQFAIPCRPTWRSLLFSGVRVLFRRFRNSLRSLLVGYFGKW